MAVNLKTAGTNIHIGQPNALFPWTDSTLAWDVAPDGKRFLAATLPDSGSKPITLITIWTAPVNKK
jgi:hypothetical protein